MSTFEQPIRVHRLSRHNRQPKGTTSVLVSSPKHLLLAWEKTIVRQQILLFNYAGNNAFNDVLEGLGGSVT